MHILMIADRWSNGGVPSVMKSLSECLVKNGVQVSWLFYYEGPKSEQTIPFYELNAKYSGDPKAFISIKSLIKKMNPDVIHDHFGGIWAASFLFTLYRKKAILHYHNEFNVIDESPDQRRTLKESFFKKILLKKYAKVIAVSKHNAKTIQAQGIHAVQVIPNGIKIPVFQKKRVFSELTIGFIGRLVFEKGVDTLIEAIGLIPKIKIKVLIAGDGDPNYSEQLQNLIRKYKLTNIQFLGRVENKSEFFNQIDVMYFGSRQEPFGLTLLEAWVYQTPVIGFYPENGGGPYEILKPGSKIGGTLIEGRSAKALSELITRIAENPNWISQKTEKIHDKIEPYEQSKIMQEWISLYQSIVL